MMIGMDKGEIYQNGFYLMVGAILGIIGTCTFNSVARGPDKDRGKEGHDRCYEARA